MISITENPAAQDPRANLSKAERDALASIAFFKRQWRKDGRIQVGNKTFSKTTIANLKRKQLLRGEVPSLSPTLAGDLAIDRLKGPHS